MNLIHKILKTISHYGMLRGGERVLVAVSGGPDSLFLLHILSNLKHKLGITLYIAHMDHGVRGIESKRDLEFVKKIAKNLRIKLILKSLSLKDVALKLSLEEILREKRYDFFKTAAKKLKANTVATAHTLDDQAETVLMRIVKGATLKGLIGVHPVRVDKGVTFIRPLIEIEKNDIIKYLKEKKIPFRIDRTNLKDKFLRNRFRNKVLPYLEKINPRIKRSLFNLAESLREDFEFIEGEKKKKSYLLKGKARIHSILIRDLAQQPKALQREILREALTLSRGNIKKLTFRHWKDIDNFMRTKKTGKSIDLPGGIRMRKTQEHLIFTK